jgi:hypothetical protein
MNNTIFSRRRFLQGTAVLAAGTFFPISLAQDNKLDPLETLEPMYRKDH